jgi:hypothetical protein
MQIRQRKQQSLVKCGDPDIKVPTFFILLILR